MSAELYTAADLRDHARLQRPVATADGAGGETRTYVDVDDLWCQRSVLSGHEALQAGGVQSTLTERVALRYRADLMAGWRLAMDDGTALEILAIREVVRRQWVELDCSGER